MTDRPTAHAQRRDHVLVLAEERPARLKFAFRGRRWAVICAVLAVVAGGGLIWAAPASSAPELLGWLGYGVVAMFAFAAVSNAFTQRELVLDGTGRQLRDVRRSAFSRSDQTCSFDALEEVTIYRNSTGSAGRSAFVRVMLVGDAGDAWVLGTSELGIASVDEARRIAGMVATLTGAQLREDPSTTRQR